MRRALRITVWVSGAVLGLMIVLAAVLLAAGNSAPGRTVIEQVTARLTSGRVRLSGLGGSFPRDLTLGRLELVDDRGTWLTADRIAVHWSPLALLERRVHVDRLEAARVAIERAPYFAEPGGKISIPHIEVDQFSIDVLELGAELAGKPARLSARGHARLNSLEGASADIAVRGSDGNGEYTLKLNFDPKRMDALLELHEPAGGPLENILGLPGLGALSASLKVEGPREAERIDLTVSAGEVHARAAGRVDLSHRSGDLDYSLESPALRPRPGLAWQRLALTGAWHGTVSAPAAEGRLEVAGLQVADARIGALSADLTASRGNLNVRARVAGLEIPGPQPQLLARDPMQIDASLRLDDAARPLKLAATHQLFSLKATAVTAGQPRVSLELKVPDIAPFAALLGQDVRGDAAIKAEVVRRATDIGVSIDASAGLAGGRESWIPLLERGVALKASGVLSDAALTLERLQVRAPSLSLNVDGLATRTHRGASNANPAGRSTLGDYVEKLETRWELNVSKLALLAPELAGGLRASGHLRGAPASLSADAALTSTLSIRGSPTGTVSGEIRAQDLLSAPSGTLQVHGMLDGAPLKFDAALDRGARQALHVRIRTAEWKSASLAGEMTILPARMEDSRGQLHLTMGQIGDFDRVLGVNIAGGIDGSIDFTPHDGRAHAEFELAGRDLRAGSFAGSVEIKGRGVPNSVALELAVQVPDLYGAPGNLAATAQLDLDADQLRLATGVVHYRGEELRLLAPAHLEFAHGLSIDRLQLGVRNAVLALDGQLLPALDVRASLRHLEPPLVNVFIPDLLDAGTIEAQMQLQGRLDAPTGDVTLTARGLRSASPDAAGIPPLDLNVNATLAVDTVSIDARLSAAGNPLLNVKGSAPLSEGGVLDLKVQGKLDVALASALFEAHGMQVGGQVAVNATVTGQSSAPKLHGTMTLAHGKWRDYVRGFSLSDINAEVTGSEAAFRITSFKATAASGTVSMTGTIGVLAPGIPVNLEITATNAQVIASNLLTANSNVNVRVTGTARKRIDIAGKINVNRAIVGIPDALPPNVAVLDVRRRGQPAAAAPARPLTIGFDLTIHAPQEVLVQGRGLDAELGGDLHIGGTSDAPIVSGGFDLRQGSVSLAGNRLKFTPPGRVSFGGEGLRNNIDPTLDFTAQNTYGDITATLRITGYADSPIFTFSSAPPQPQDETMAILLFGEPSAQLSALQVAQIGAALTGAGNGLNPLSKIQKALGFDRLSVSSATTTTSTGATQSTGTAIAAGRYVSKNVYVEAKQTSTGQSQLQVDIELTKRLKLQTRLGNGTAVTQGTTPENDPGSSVGLSYQFEY